MSYSIPRLLDGTIDTEKLGADFNWYRLPSSISNMVRKIYLDELPDWIKSKDIATIEIRTLSGYLVSTGYNRIVIGDFGAYIEFDESQALIDDYIVKPGQEYRQTPQYANTKYNWLCHRLDQSIKIYYQKRTVSYADYKVGMYYVSWKQVLPARRSS